MKDIAALAGRVLLVALFVFAGYSKFMGLDGTARYIASKGLPMPQVLAMAAAVVEMLVAILIIVGFKTRYAALLLAAFTLLVTPIFHDYWNLADPQRYPQYLHFWKNMAMLGGLLVLAAHGPGAYSLDGRDRDV
jgi:putative oxidoreductase